ncbi:MAG: peptidase M16 [candidate division Zixibacteria bacterium CG_4_9_14_3_um_filter_46_8]|nr:MAG: peptidase M16 [candidate division Zixibacteria bacterium CG_4_9_14_3_um_filter_46_8]
MRKLSAKLLLILTGILFLIPQATFGFDFSKLENSVSEYTLSNGLKVLIMERHDAPVASFVTWANVGSVDDPKGYTGLAHMFEHIAFKGTTTLGTKDIRRELELIAIEDSIFMELRAERNKGRLADSLRIKQLTEAYEKSREASYELVIPNEFGNTIRREGGVNLNAFTSEDQTVYFFSLPSNKVELWMALESERFLNPVFREMYKERDVVAEERRMRTDSSPVGRLIEEFFAMAFKAHPYGVPGIGNMSDIQYYSRQEAKAFFEKYYGPSNLTIAIVGDVNKDEVLKLAKQYWERIPYRPAPERIATIEPDQLGERRMELEDPSQPFYIVGWHTPENTHPDAPIINVLSDYLVSGRTSLLYESLVKEKKIAVQVGSFSNSFGGKYPTLFTIYAVPAAGHTNYECEKEIFSALEKLQNDPILLEEIEKVKARAKSEFINNLKRNLGLAMQLCGYQQYYGDWRELFHELDRINAVTPDDVQRVAKKYLNKNNRTVAMMNTIGAN